MFASVMPADFYMLAFILMILVFLIAYSLGYSKGYKIGGNEKEKSIKRLELFIRESRQQKR